MTNLFERIRESLSTHKVRRTAMRWLAVLVVFATTYSLVLPAITMTTTLRGELEDVNVRVEAGKGVLPEGTELVLSEVLLPGDEPEADSEEDGDAEQLSVKYDGLRRLTEDEVQLILNAALDGRKDMEAAIVKVLDISLDHSGDEIEPLDAVRLTLKSDLIRDAEQPVIVHLDDESNATRLDSDNSGDKAVVEFGELTDEEESEEKELPKVDSEGYLLDENGDRVVNEDGSFTRYEVDEDGNLVLDEDDNPVLVEDPDAEETEDPEESKDPDAEETEDPDAEESKEPDAEESKEPDAEESKEPEESKQPEESKEPEESKQPEESKEPEPSKEPETPAEPDPEPSAEPEPEAPSAEPEPQPEPEPEAPAVEPEPQPEPEAPVVDVPEEPAPAAEAPASYQSDEPVASEPKSAGDEIVAMTDGFSVYAIVDLTPKAEEDKIELPTVDSEGYVIDENGDRVTDEDGNFIRYEVDVDGNLVLDEDGYPILVVAPQLPTVDSEGYVIDENGNRVINEDGKYTRYQVDADGKLILDEDGNPIPAEADTEPVELNETVSNDLYQMAFHVYYTGEHAEDDELVFTPNCLDVSEDETDRTYEYTSLITSSLIAPMGRTEFSLTKNGETVDRSEYTVSVEITPSRAAMAWLIQSGGYDTMEELNLTEETEDGETITVIPGFVANEISEETEENPKALAPSGHIDIDLETLDALRLDVDSYMAAMYDENGEPNPDALYDSDYSFTAEIKGEDFFMTSGMVGDILDTMVSQGHYYGENWLLWDGLKVTKRNSAGTPTAGTHDEVQVKSVKMTHSNSSGNVNGQEYTINEGTKLTQINTEELRTSLTEQSGVQLKDVFPKATTSLRDYAVLEIEPNEGYYVNEIVITCVQGTRDNYIDKSNFNGYRNPYECSNLSGGHAYSETFTVSKGTSVKCTLDSEAFSHGPDEYFLYILISTAPVPSPLFVQYVPGQIGNTDLTTTNNAFNGTNWLTGIGVNDGRMNETENIYHEGRVDEIYKSANENEPWPAGSLRYTTAGISDAAKAAALEVGYTFAGWKLEYFNEAWVTTGSETSGYYTARWSLLGDYDLCKKSHDHASNGCVQAEYGGKTCWFKKVSFGDYALTWHEGSSGTTTSKIENVMQSGFGNIELKVPYGSTYGDLGEFEKLQLVTNARLTAIWEPNPQLEVTKKVENMEGMQFTPTTYTFKIERTDGIAVETYTVIETTMENGNIRYNENTVEGNTFELSVTGNRSSSIRIKGLEEGKEYKIEENVPEDAKYKPTYTVNGETGDTFTAKGPKETHVALTVTNDYAAPKGFDITIEKVEPKSGASISETDIPSSATAPTDATGKWTSLSGATFTLDDVTANNKNVFTEKATTADGIRQVITWNNLTPDHLYKLTETKTADGHTQFTDPIYFTVSEQGVITLRNADNNADVVDNHNYAVVSNSTLVVANYPSKSEVQFVKTVLGSDPVQMLPGAKFALYDNEDNAKTDSITNPVKAVYVGESGDDGVVEWTPNLAAGSSPKKVLTFDINSTYYLKELKAPDGYNAMTGIASVTMNVSGAPTVTGGSVRSAEPITTSDGSTIQVIHIENHAGSVLPSTGGPGTSLYTVLGAVLMLTAAVLVLEFKRKGRARA